MEKLIFKKFSADHAIFFLYIAISISLIVWVIQAVNFLDIVSEDGHSFRIYFLYTILNLPKIFSRILPFIFFISLFYIIVKYENNNELIIFWTTGIKKIEFVNTIVKLSLIYLLFQLFLTSYLVPKTQDTARSYIRSSNIDFFSGLIKEKKFIDPVSGLTIFVNKKKPDGSFEKIFLKDKSTTNKRYQIIYAEKGKIVNNKNINFLVLNKGKIINNDGGNSTVFNFEKTEFNLSKYSTKTTTFPKIQEINSDILLNCVYSLKKKLVRNELFDEYFACNEENSKSMKQELFKRIIIPFYLPLISLIAAMLIIQSKDHYSYNRFRIVLFILGTLSIIFSEISVRYSIISELTTVIFIIVPILLFILTYILLSNRLKILR